ncbi:MAG: hypothetical protein U0X73_03115 [Thermoanaerobaculia bacterium]
MRKTGGKRLGEILEERGRITREQLLRALRNQKVVGGKLGTCLLEIDALPEEALLAALAEQNGVPFATPDDLRGIPDEVTHLIPAKIARRILAVPFRSGGTQLSVAMVNVKDLSAQDEIAFVSGRRARVHVTTEVRIYEALEKYYGEECPSRMAKLLDRLNRSYFLWGRDRTGAERPHSEELHWDPQIATGNKPGPAQTGVTLPSFAPAPELASPPFPNAATPPEVQRTVTASIEELGLASPAVTAPIRLDLPLQTPAPAAPIASSPDSREQAVAFEPSASAAPAAPEPAAPRAQRPAAAAPATTTPPPPAALVPPVVVEKPPLAEPAVARAGSPVSAPPAEPMTLQAVEKRLLEPRDRDQVGDAVLDFLAARFLRVVLLVVRKDEVASWKWRGQGIDDAHLGAYRIDFQQPSVFLNLRQGSPAFRGALPPMAAHRNLLFCWQDAQPEREVIVAPVRLKDRLVAAIYAEPAGPSPSPEAFADLQRLAAKTAIAFELLIMRSKLKNA